MMSAWKKFRRTIEAFREARGGNVAIIFAIATVPILGAVGAAYDYSHANAVKASMQAALDSTALMLSKEAATDSTGTLQANALNYFSALFTHPEATNITITTSYSSTGGSSAMVNGSVDVPTRFVRVFDFGTTNFDNITVNGSSTAAWGSNRLRVALVLDNTGSMADNGKITALKSATNSLLTQLQNAASTNGDVYVSIVPFVKDVNLGAANYTSDWIYWGTSAQDPSLTDNNSWDANNGTCSLSGYSDRGSCVANASCSIAGYTTQSSC